MKKYLISEKGNFYKANLHCHSTVSDGELSPEELKERYKAKGYSIIAYTDHNLLVSHDDLCEDSFLALNGYELDVNDPNTSGANIKTCHMCFIALNQNNVTQVLYHRTHYKMPQFNKFIDVIKYDETKPDYVREYTPEKISEMMKVGRDNGFFVTYNHPTWSLENYNDYINYNNMHAMEMFNSTCNTIWGIDEYNPRVYDDMLRAGKRIYCIATDDNHREKDLFGGFTMIKAEKLEYEQVTDALVKGDFYCSQAPEIYQLYIEEDEIVVTCSKAIRIIYSTANRRALTINSEDGEFVQSARFKMLKDDIYFRITIIDEKGKRANTNAYFIDEL